MLRANGMKYYGHYLAVAPLSFRYKVQENDCIASIAFQYGFDPNTLWNHPENEELKTQRKDPHILYPGDEVFVPDKETRQEARPTDQKHVFRRKAVPARFRIRFVVDGNPQANEPFRIDFDTATVEGKTDANGVIDLPISPKTRRVKLTVGKPGALLVYDLALGSLDPIDSPLGVKKRLSNLGFPCSLENDKMDESTSAAIAAFQRYINHPNVTGEMDDLTKQTLQDLHDQP
jgi:hypothetical protein